MFNERGESDAMNLEPNEFITEWHNVSELAPHVKLFVNESFKAKDLSPMIKDASQAN